MLKASKASKLSDLLIVYSCPKIGCSHTDVRMSDLIQDEALRRAIENHNKKKNRHSE